MSRVSRSTRTRRFCRRPPALLLRCEPPRAEVHRRTFLCSRARPRPALGAVLQQRHRDRRARLRPRSRPRRRPSPSTRQPRGRRTHPRRHHRRSRPGVSREALRVQRCPDHQASQSASASLPIRPSSGTSGALISLRHRAGRNPAREPHPHPRPGRSDRPGTGPEASERSSRTVPRIRGQARSSWSKTATQ